MRPALVVLTDGALFFLASSLVLILFETLQLFSAPAAVLHPPFVAHLPF